MPLNRKEGDGDGEVVITSNSLKLSWATVLSVLLPLIGGGLGGGAALSLHREMQQTDLATAIAQSAPIIRIEERIRANSERMDNLKNTDEDMHKNLEQVTDRQQLVLQRLSAIDTRLSELTITASGTSPVAWRFRLKAPAAAAAPKP